MLLYPVGGSFVVASKIALGTQHPASRKGKDLEGSPRKVLTHLPEARSLGTEEM